MKQPKCPWCGMGFRGGHVEGFREEGRCGSQWFPDFEGGHTKGRKQSEACREIARLKIAHLRRMAERADCLRSGWTKMACLVWASRRAAALDRFRSACLAKITELKEPQCLTKS